MKSTIKIAWQVFLIPLAFVSIVLFTSCKLIDELAEPYDPCPNGVECNGGCCNDGKWCGTDNMCHSSGGGGGGGGCTPTGCPSSYPWYGCGTCWTTSALCHSRGTSDYRDDCSVCRKCP